MVKQIMTLEQVFKNFFLSVTSKQKEDVIHQISKTPPTPPLKNSNTYLKSYRLNGKPCSMSRARDLAFKGWNSQKSAVQSCEKQLLEQHLDEPLFTGMLHLDVVFYFQPSAAYKRESLRGKLCKDGPNIDGLIKFVEQVCFKVIFNQDVEIVSVSAKKLYDDNARTELHISRY